MSAPFFDRKISPPLQAVFVFAFSLVAMGLHWLLGKTGLYKPDPLFPWSVATGFLLLFALINSLFSLNADSFMRYWGSSMYSYMALAFSNGAAAWLISGLPLAEAGSYRAIYIVITFGFLVFLSMVNLMKKIVRFAEKEEWNNPKIRKRK